MAKLFVYGIDPSCPRETLEGEFGRCGEVTDVYNTEKGYAFVTMADDDGADQAIRELNGTVTDSQEIKVDNTRKRKSSEILSEIQQENQRLKEARTCKICMDNEIEVALYPCGHLVSCVNCSFHLIDCPVCRKFIKRIVRTYMS